MFIILTVNIACIFICKVNNYIGIYNSMNMIESSLTWIVVFLHYMKVERQSAFYIYNNHKQITSYLFFYYFVFVLKLF